MSDQAVGRIEQLTHTPGPWGLSQPQGLKVVAAPDKVICRMNTAEPHEAPRGNFEADARLIAAAPELLNALRRMLDCHQAAMDAAQSSASAFIEKRCECGACDEARAAVASAEGRS